MSILFSVIANNKEMIHKHAFCSGNFMDIVSEVLAKIPDKDNKMTYLHGKYLFNYIIENQYVYLCVTDKACQRSRAFLFLNEIKRLFQCKIKEDYSSILAEEMLRFSRDYNNVKIEAGELDEINRIEVENSEVILGEKILLIKNEDNIEFSKISYVGRPPEKINVTVGSTNLYVIFGIGIILAVLVMLILGPVTLITVIAIIFVISMKRKK
ncbi:vesicle-associated membrane protein 7-like [Battus philenor]|uniref:vesicle-associated membrane protein 7-like n=1 Tax=Battus philenor TaxID=42288 RepID=UPI0035CFBB02